MLCQAFYIDSSFCEKVYKNLNVPQGSLESLSEFINCLSKEAFPEENKPNEDNIQIKPEETKLKEEKQSEKEKKPNLIINDDIFEKTEEYSEVFEETYDKCENLKKIFNEFNFYDELPEIDEDAFIFFMNCLISMDLESESHKQMRKLFKSFFLIPKIAYKILDFFMFTITFNEEYLKACKENQTDVLETKLSQNLLQADIYDLRYSPKKLYLPDIKDSILRVLHFFCEKKIMLPLLINTYTFGCTPLIFENATFKQFDSVKELRDIISKRKIEAKKETTLEKLVQNNSDSTNFMETLKDVIVYKEDVENNVVKYPKISTNVPKSIIANNYSSKLDFANFANNFDTFSKLMGKNINGLIELALKNIHQEIEKWVKNHNIKKKRSSNTKIKIV